MRINLKKCSFLFYPDRDRILVDNGRPHDLRRAVRYATFCISCPGRYRHLALKMTKCHDRYLCQMSISQNTAKMKIRKKYEIAIWHKYRDFDVENLPDSNKKLDAFALPADSTVKCNFYFSD